MWHILTFIYKCVCLHFELPLKYIVWLWSAFTGMSYWLKIYNRCHTRIWVIYYCNIVCNISAIFITQWHVLGMFLVWYGRDQQCVLLTRLMPWLHNITVEHYCVNYVWISHMYFVDKGMSFIGLWDGTQYLDKTKYNPYLCKEFLKYHLHIMWHSS